MNKFDVIQKLKSLSEKGVSGEKENATRLLNKLMKKYNITENELQDDETRGVIVDLKDNIEVKLCNQILWAYFDANCNSDKVELMSGIKQFLRSFSDNVVTVISTARSERLRHQTAKKLWQYKIGFEEMYMRRIDDYREAKEVKREHLLQIMDNYEVVCFIDDDLGNCEMARDLGILALRRV